MYIETKNGRIYEPCNPVNTGLWEWLNTYIVLEGSAPYEEIRRIYDMQEYDYQRQVEDYQHHKQMEVSA